MPSDISHLLHDVRNPLNTISINSELGKLSLKRNADVDRAVEIFDTILKECRVCSDKLTELKAALVESPQG